MRTVDEIKAAASKLDPRDQVELFEWWTHTETFKQRHLAMLKAELDKGISDLENGRYQTYTDETLMQLAEDIGRSGREQLKKTERKKGE